MGPQALKVLSRGCSGKTHLWGQMIENPNREKNQSPSPHPPSHLLLKVAAFLATPDSLKSQLPGT